MEVVASSANSYRWGDRRRRGKTRGNSPPGHGRACPGHPNNRALCDSDRDRRDKPGDDATSFAPLTDRPGYTPSRISKIFRNK